MIDGRTLVPAPLARGARGAVVAPHHLATVAGLAVLADGGSAVDAAIATNAVLAVVVPNGCGIGGDAFWLIWSEGARRLEALNGSGRAAAGVDPVALRSAGLDRIPLRGPDPITVPGAVRSWADAHVRFGRLPRERVLGPAIELARDGFPAWVLFARAVEQTAEALGDAPWARAFHSVYRPAGRPWREGELVQLPPLAATLERLASEGFEELYEGDTGEHAAAALESAGSPIRMGDLRSHASDWSEPIDTTYRGVRAATHPPNSAGIVALETLNILERFEPPAAGTFGPAGVTDPAWIHLGIEASKLALGDRDAWLTDGDHLEPGVVDRLLDRGRAAELASRIDPRRASTDGPPSRLLVGGTIWLGVVDGEGNTVSLIQSNASGFGSGVVDPITGIHFQNRGASFALDPDHPNVIAPRKRTLHSLMPGMLFRDGRPWVVVGSMGGDAQPQIHAQVVSALVDGGVDVATAVSAPRWFVEPDPTPGPATQVRIEPRFGADVLEGLESLRHPLSRVEPFDGLLGHCHAIELVDGGPAAGGTLAAATDPRSAGLPAAR